MIAHTRTTKRCLTFEREGTTITLGLDQQAEYEMKFEDLSKDSEYMIEVYQIVSKFATKK